VECPRDGVGRGDPLGQTRELTGKPSMQEGMMDGDVRVRPYGCQWNVNDEHWDECPSVFDLRWNIRGSG